MVNITSMSPLGSFPVDVRAGRPRPARIDLNGQNNQIGSVRQSKARTFGPESRF